MPRSPLNTSLHTAILNTTFVIFTTIIVFTRFNIFLRYNLEYIDSDQPLLWLGARDYAAGRFYEPRFYGQDYNTFMECLFAVPLLWLNVHVYQAVPLATHFISLFPFIFTASYLFFRHSKLNALLALAVIMCLPAPYDLLNSLPRGFVTGLFFCSFFVISIVNPRNYTFLFVNSVFAVTGYFVNPNSALVCLPFLFLMFLHHYRNKKYYYVTLPCLLSAVPLDIFFNRFYREHPDFIQGNIDYGISFDSFVSNICGLDQTFGHLSFFIQNNCLMLLVALVSLIIFLYFINKKAFMAACLFVVLILGSFFMRKTLDGSTWVYTSSGRMFLGIPLMIVLFLSVHRLRLRQGVLLGLLVIPFTFSIIKLGRLDHTLAWHFEEKNWSGNHLIRLNSALDAIRFYKDVTKRYGADFMLISNGFWMNTVLAYGGPATDEDYPPTLETRYEKRYWVREKYQNKVFEKFLLVAWRNDLEKRIPATDDFKFQTLDNYGLTYVTDNRLTMAEFVEQLNVAELKDMPER